MPFKRLLGAATLVAATCLPACKSTNHSSTLRDADTADQPVDPSTGMTANSDGSPPADNAPGTGDSAESGSARVQVDFKGKDGTLAQLLYKAFRDAQQWDDADNDVIAATHESKKTGVKRGDEKVKCKDDGTPKIACSIDIQAVQTTGKKFETRWNGNGSISQALFNSINTSTHMSTGGSAAQQVNLTGADGNWIQCQLSTSDGVKYKCYFRVE